MVKSITSVQLKTITVVGVQRVRNISSKIILEDGETVKVTKETLLIVILFFFFFLVTTYFIIIIFNLYYVSLLLGNEEQGMGKFNLFILLVSGKCQ